MTPRDPRRAFSAALIGPDGAGKSTICRRLEQTAGLPIRCIYMGVNPDSSNVLLPTTRLLSAVKRALGIARDSGPPDLEAPERREEPRVRSGGFRRAARSLKATLGLVNRMAEEWYRQAAAAWMRGQGYVVLFDRHFVFDYHHDFRRADAPGQPAGRRLHAAMLKRFYPRPDLVICLDAPGEVMFARKGEGTIEILEKRRQDYLSARELAPNFVVVDVSRPVEEVTREVAGLLEEFYARRGCNRPTETASAGR